MFKEILILYFFINGDNMKRKILLVLVVILLIIVTIGMMYIIDKNRKKNNKPVIFSTWGDSYTPPIDLDENKIKESINVYLLNKNNNTVKVHNEKWFFSMKIYLLSRSWNKCDNKF